MTRSGPTSTLPLASILLAALCGACGSEGGSDADASTDTPGDGGADTDTTGDSDPRFDAFVEALRADLAASTAYGVSAAVMEDGVVTFAQAFGSKDPDLALPLTPGTLMQIGSTTKQMTAVALLRKVEDGLVSLDDTLEETLPEMEFTKDAAWDDQITLRHLLSHQGGLVDWTLGDVSSDDAALASYLYGAFAEQAYLMSPPGAFWNYSNPNFALAGLVTEALDTRPWPDIMRDDVFGPLGMPRTFARKTEVEADGDYALSYGLGLDDLTTGAVGPVSMDQMPDPAGDRPAGFVWTTPTQMMAWARFIMDGDPDVLSDALRGEITTAQVDTLFGAGSMSYGYGMFVETGYYALNGEWYEMPVWEHGGATMSFSHVFYILPDSRFAVAICSSAYEADFSRSLDAAITTLVDLPEPTAAPKYEIDPAQFDRHVGTYTDPWNVGDMVITRQGDTLLADMPAMASYGYTVRPELEPLSSDIFYMYIDDTPYDITFIPLTAGGPSQYARNRAFVTTRVPDAAPAAPTLPLASREDVARLLRQARMEPS
ncbi:MAG: serine hydrolase, partial [Deltaproteobacteria bacterium]|nr:serine hydrolase [Deltaproteobacteria bacterium]